MRDNKERKRGEYNVNFAFDQALVRFSISLLLSAL